MDKKKTVTKVPGITPFVRVLMGAGILVIILAVLSVINLDILRSARAVESVDSLSGQKIACCVGWESDMLLSGRSDITLFRYDNNTDSVTALAFGQVDAVAMDEISANHWFSCSKGLVALPNPIARIGFTAYASFGARDRGVLEEFNAFLADFKATPDYADFRERAFLLDGQPFHSPELPDPEGDKVLTVGYLPEGYAEGYLDSVSGEPGGYGIEIFKRFALEAGYSVSYVPVSMESSLVELAANRVDFVLAGLTDVYLDEIERGGRFTMTEPFLTGDVLVLVIGEGQTLEITGEPANA